MCGIIGCFGKVDKKQYCWKFINHRGPDEQKYLEELIGLLD